MSRIQVKKMVLSALMLALCLVLPFLTGQIPQVGRMLLPMHIPVLLCGFICGWPWALAVGFVAPILRSTIFTMPMMIAPIVTATIWKLIFSPIYGVLNGILVTFGFERVNWMAETIPARIALVIVEVWATTPLCMLIFIAALQTVPDDLLEAATIDGGTFPQKFTKVILPLIRNFIALVVTMRFMDAIRMFDIVYNLTNGGPGTATETLASTIYKMAFRYYNVGEGSAGAFIFFILIMLFSLLFVKILGTNESTGREEA